MEKVFWLMWLSDLVEAFTAVGVIAFGCSILSIGTYFCAKTDKEDWYRIPRNISIVLLFLGFFAVILPSKKTVQLMAIASAGEAAINTKLGQKGLEAIDAVLDGIIVKVKK